MVLLLRKIRLKHACLGSIRYLQPIQRVFLRQVSLVARLAMNLKCWVVVASSVFKFWKLILVCWFISMTTLWLSVLNQNSSDAGFWKSFCCWPCAAFTTVTKEVCKLPSFFSSCLFKRIDVSNSGLVTRSGTISSLSYFKSVRVS